MLLLFPELSRLDQLRQVRAAVDCRVVLMAFPADVGPWLCDDNIRYQLLPQFTKCAVANRFATYTPGQL